MRSRHEPLFLARQNYRRRRIEDAARLLPLLGGILFLLPLMVGGDIGPMRLVYVFSAWFMLILSALLLARHLGKQDAEDVLSGSAPSTPSDPNMDRH